MPSNLKRRVRERMKKTGESYETALLAVKAEETRPSVEPVEPSPKEPLSDRVRDILAVTTSKLDEFRTLLAPILPEEGAEGAVSVQEDFSDPKFVLVRATIVITNPKTKLTLTGEIRFEVDRLTGSVQACVWYGPDSSQRYRESQRALEVSVPIGPQVVDELHRFVKGLLWAASDLKRPTNVEPPALLDDDASMFDEMVEEGTPQEPSFRGTETFYEDLRGQMNRVTIFKTRDEFERVCKEFDGKGLSSVGIIYPDLALIGRAYGSGSEIFLTYRMAPVDMKIRVVHYQRTSVPMVVQSEVIDVPRYTPEEGRPLRHLDDVLREISSAQSWRCDDPKNLRMGMVHVDTEHNLIVSYLRISLLKELGSRLQVDGTPFWEWYRGLAEFSTANLNTSKT